MQQKNIALSLVVFAVAGMKEGQKEEKCFYRFSFFLATGGD